MIGGRHGWVDATTAGFRAMGSSHYREAAGHWLAARDALPDADPDDPRRAAGETNAGVALALLGEPGEADAALAAAERSWMRLLGRAGTSPDIPVKAGSSSFHFRLASENLAVFQDLHRMRIQRQCEAALAITRFNRLVASAGPARENAIVSTLASLLSDILGARSPEVRLLSAGPLPASETRTADSPYADKVAALDARLIRTAAFATDTWQLLEAAVPLTALLRPGFLSGAAARAEDAFEVRAATSSRR